MEWSGLWHDEYALHWSNWLAVRRGGGCTRDHEHQHVDPAKTCRRHGTRAAQLVRLYNRELHYERMFVVNPPIGSRRQRNGQQGEERARVPPTTSTTTPTARSEPAAPKAGVAPLESHTSRTAALTASLGTFGEDATVLTASLGAPPSFRTAARTDSRGSFGDHARRRSTAQLAGDASLSARAMANLAPALRKSKAKLTAPDEPAVTRLGALLVAAGRYTDAADVLALASEVDPMSPGPLYELGNLQVRNV